MSTPPQQCHVCLDAFLHVSRQEEATSAAACCCFDLLKQAGSFATPATGDARIHTCKVSTSTINVKTTKMEATVNIETVRPEKGPAIVTTRNGRIGLRVGNSSIRRVKVNVVVFVSVVVVVAVPLHFESLVAGEQVRDKK